MPSLVARDEREGGKGAEGDEKLKSSHQQGCRSFSIKADIVGKTFSSVNTRHPTFECSNEMSLSENIFLKHFPGNFPKTNLP